MSDRSQAVDDYLAALPDRPRRALERLRAAIRRIVPEAEEGISYGMPVFRLRGRPIIGYRAASKHCALYPFSGRVVSGLAEALVGFDVGQGTVRFAADKVPPAALLKQIIQARIRELTADNTEFAEKTGKKQRRRRST
ncbi:MAG: DUF1801 domain-containing protein [Gemmataceae bacterium]|nr:DUF1801 domain-containing protein [Gemmataceae bacterium]